jgi:hypothetical protein
MLIEQRLMGDVKESSWDLNGFGALFRVWESLIRILIIFSFCDLIFDLNWTAAQIRENWITLFRRLDCTVGVSGDVFHRVHFIVE